MNILNVLQKSPEWLAVRRTHKTASEAPAALGQSKYMSRNALLSQKATGIVEDVDNFKQSLFDKGHAAEEKARPFAEAIIGSDLYPITATVHVDGIDLLASFDGATMDEDVIWEHKLYSESLAAAVRSGNLEPHYTIQLDQQLLVSKATKCLFMTSDGTEENMAWCWYEPDQAKFDALVAGWKQFDADLADYQHVEVLPAAVAAPTMALPALSIQVNGAISLQSNLIVFGDRLKSFIDEIDKNPSDDQAFADAEAAVKVLSKAEEALQAAESSALAQTASIDEMCNTVAMYKDLARTTRLMLEKVVKARKETIRIEIMQAGKDKAAEHIAGLNKRLGKTYMPVVPVDFAGVMKGKKSIASLRDAVDTELARFKIEANSVADKIQFNLDTLRDIAADHKFLFSDAAQIVLKANDDCTALIRLRIAEHKEANENRLAAERERIQEEERIKAEAKVKAEQAAAARDAAPNPGKEMFESVGVRVVDVTETRTRSPGTAPASFPFPTQATATTPPTLTLGKISARLGFPLTADFLRGIGFEPAGRERSAVLYHETVWPSMCQALIAHINSVRELQQQAA